MKIKALLLAAAVPGLILSIALAKAPPRAPGNVRLAGAAREIPGLILHYKFDEGTGNSAPDSSTSKVDAALKGPAWTAGKVGDGAVAFDGVDDYAQPGELPGLTGASALTVSTWFKFERSTGAQSFVSRWNDSFNGAFTLFWSEISSAYLFAVATPAGVAQTSALLAPDTNWHHLVGVYNGSDVRLYFDGVQRGAPAPASGPINADPYPLRIGSHNSNSAYFSGLLDDTRIYARALTPQEIASLCALATGGCPPPPPPIDPGGGSVPRPAVVINAPANGAEVSGYVIVSATATDEVGLRSVRFERDDHVLFAEDFEAPFSATLNTASLPNGAHSIVAIARSLAEKYTPSTAVTIHTSNPIDLTAPALSQVAAGAGVTAVTVSWLTDEQADTRLDYGTDVSYASSTSVLSSYTTAHMLRLTGLAANTRYHFRLKAQDPSGNLSTSQDYTFTTGALSTTAQVIDNSGGNTLLDLPSSALWSSIVNFRPGHGEVVTLNPPRFSWMYYPDPLMRDCPNGIPCSYWAPKRFLFQVATSPDFAAGAIRFEKRTEVNFYNFIGANDLPAGVPLYWRVGYIETNDPSNPATWDLQDASYPSNPQSFSAVRSFRIDPAARVWSGREKLADEAYLSAHGAHPHVLFTAATRAGLFTDLEATGQGADSEWSKAKAAALSFDPNLPIDSFNSAASQALALERLAFAWQMTLGAPSSDAAAAALREGIARRSSLGDVTVAESLARLGDWYATSTPRQYTLDVGKNSSPVFIKALAYGYDWLYDELDADQRQRVRRAIDAYLRHHQGALEYPAALNKFPTTFWVDPGYSLFNSGASHANWDVGLGFTAALAAYNDDDPVARKYLDFYMNYMIGWTHFAGPDGGLDQGRGYDVAQLITSSGQSMVLHNHMLAQIAFPEAGFNKNPFWKNFADWYRQTTPTGFVQADEPWGDGGAGAQYDIARPEFGRDLAYFLGDGKLYRQFQNERGARFGNQPMVMPLDEILFPFYARDGVAGLSVPTPIDDSPRTTLLNVHDGWAAGCSGKLNTADCFSNGVGYIFRASPRNIFGTGTNNHSSFGGLSYQLWAYGAPLTSAGETSINYLSKYSIDHYSVLVDGLGMWQTPYFPNVPYYARLYAHREGPNYTYFAADGTNAYARALNNSARVQPGPYFAGPHAHLKKAIRHFLFIKNYFVIYDELETSEPARFSWLYPVSYFYTTAGGLDNLNWPSDAVAHEPFLEATASSTSFTYKSGTVFPNGPYALDRTTRVDVKVALLKEPGSLDMRDQKGSAPGDNVRSNPITGQDHYAEGDAYPRAHVIWATNKVPSTEGRFMAVVYPIKPGTSAADAPVIERLDDFTARVTNPDDTVDVISFNPQTAASHGATIVVDLAALRPTPVVDDVKGVTYQPAPYVPPFAPAP